MVREIDGRRWWCCPVCGKKLLQVNPGASCRGVQIRCRGRKPDGTPCRKEMEIII